MLKVQCNLWYMYNFYWVRSQFRIHIMGIGLNKFVQWWSFPLTLKIHIQILIIHSYSFIHICLHYNMIIINSNDYRPTHKKLYQRIHDLHILLWFWINCQKSWFHILNKITIMSKSSYSRKSLIATIQGLTLIVRVTLFRQLCKILQHFNTHI